VLIAAAGEQPLLIVVDDVHWADPASLAYLNFLGKQVSTAAVMVVLTSEHTGPEPAARIELEPLTGWETSTALSSAIDAWPEPEFVQKVVHRGGGLPLFTIEVGRGLRPAEQPTGAVLVPAGVTKLLQRRIDSVGPRNAGVLSEAAVLGIDFDAREVAKVSGRRLDHVRAALAESLRAMLIAEKPNDPYRFGFMHPLIHARAYDRLSTEDRMTLHGQAGQLRAENWFDHAGEASSWIAEHFFRGPSPKRAAEYAKRAGDYAATVLAPENAAIHHARAQGLS
jgi:predicted ATPase